MKKNVKIILAAVVAVALAVSGIVYYLLTPADVEVVRVEAALASEYFIEEGAVVAEKTVEVYSPVSGKIVGAAAKEGGAILVGDVICTLDSAAYANAIARSRTAIEGYQAQKADLDEQRRARISELNANLVGLRSELDTVIAQENDYLAQAEDEATSANDATRKANETVAANNAQIETQLALQQIIIDQARSTYAQMEKTASDSEALYNQGAITRSEYEAATGSRDSAKSSLDAAVAQLDVIRSARLTQSSLRDARTYTEYFESMKRSIRERIAVVEGQLDEDYSTSVRLYFDALIAGELTQIEALETNIADCSITSPVTGKIVDLYIKDSNIVNASFPIALVETERSTDIEVYVSTKDFTDVKLGDAVEITQPTSSGDIVFGGIVKEIGEEAATRVSALGIIERVVKITVAPEEGAAGVGATLIPGFSFDVKFFTFTADGQLTVPKTAVFKYSAAKAAGGIVWLDGDMTGKPVEDIDMLYAATGGAIQMRQVRLGRELRADYIIEAGLGAGEAVIKDAYDEAARPGARVRF
ncbi:MAG: HlyD family efflux transporter periplasmic adaptor subunit [Oscillospiraceae bacterium]|nr:HlyD family efflux transporter periplasmic adaptor subunit [Oscillospiraceae bacterium]